MTLSCGNREGGVLTYNFTRESRNLDPFASNGLEESGEGRTAKGAVVVEYKHRIRNIEDVEEMGRGEGRGTYNVWHIRCIRWGRHESFTV